MEVPKYVGNGSGKSCWWCDATRSVKYMYRGYNLCNRCTFPSSARVPEAVRAINNALDNGRDRD